MSSAWYKRLTSSSGPSIRRGMEGMLLALTSSESQHSDVDMNIISTNMDIKKLRDALQGRRVEIFQLVSYKYL